MTQSRRPGNKITLCPIAVCVDGILLWLDCLRWSHAIEGWWISRGNTCYNTIKSVFMHACQSVLINDLSLSYGLRQAASQSFPVDWQWDGSKWRVGIPIELRIMIQWECNWIAIYGTGLACVRLILSFPGLDGLARVLPLFWRLFNDMWNPIEKKKHGWHSFSSFPVRVRLPETHEWIIKS